MDREDLYGAAARTGGGLLPALGQAPQPEHKTVQALVAAGLIALRERGQLHQIGAPLGAVGHGAEYAQQVEPVQQLPNQLLGGEIGGEGAQRLDARQKAAALFVRFGCRAQRGIEVAVAVGAAYGGQLVGRKAEDRRTQCGDQRDVLVGIIQHRQQGERGADLRRAEIAQALSGGHRHAVRRQHAAVDGAGAVGGAHQNGHVAVVHRAQAVFALHGRVGFDQGADLLRDEGGFRGGLVRRLVRVVAAPGREQIQLRYRDRTLVIVRAADQRGFFVIIQIAEAAAHAAGKDAVDRVDDLPP